MRINIFNYGLAMLNSNRQLLIISSQEQISHSQERVTNPYLRVTNLQLKLKFKIIVRSTISHRRMLASCLV